MDRRIPKYLILFFLSISFLFSACADKTKIPEDTLIKVYAEIVIAQDTTTINSKTFTEVKQTIFNKYKVTSKDYTESIKTLNKDPKQWDKFFDNVIMYVESLKPEKNLPQVKKNG